MNIKIRKATEQDSDLIAWGMLKSSQAGKNKGVFHCVFETTDDQKVLELLKKLAVTQTRSFCHYTNFIVAEADGEAAGVLCGYEPRIATHEIFTKALEELGYDESYEERVASYLLVKPEIDKKTWMLDFMAVKEGFNEFSILKEMVQKSLLTARLKGYRKAQTMIEIGSVEAKMTYEKLGFRYVDEKQSDYYKEQFGRAGIMRLQMDL
jgi:hypothetical protein